MTVHRVSSRHLDDKMAIFTGWGKFWEEDETSAKFVFLFIFYYIREQIQSISYAERIENATIFGVFEPTTLFKHRVVVPRQLLDS